MNSRLFKQLCVQEDSDYDAHLLHTVVRWLSRGKALQRVFILRDEISQFLSQCAGWSTEADLFAVSSFLMRLAFLVDIFDLLNKLNIEMQGRDHFIFQLQSKLRILLEQMGRNDFRCFAHYTEVLSVVQDHEFDVTVLNEEFIYYLQNVRDEFDRRSPELRTENYRHVQFPYAFDALALMADLQAGETEKLRYESMSIDKFRLGMDERHEQISHYVTKDLVKFGTTYTLARQHFLQCWPLNRNIEPALLMNTLNIT